MNLEAILRRLYKSEITISVFYDGGFNVSIGDDILRLRIFNHDTDEAQLERFVIEGSETIQKPKRPGA